MSLENPSHPEDQKAIDDKLALPTMQAAAEGFNTEALQDAISKMDVVDLAIFYKNGADFLESLGSDYDKLGELPEIWWRKFGALFVSVIAGGVGSLVGPGTALVSASAGYTTAAVVIDRLNRGSEAEKDAVFKKLKRFGIMSHDAWKNLPEDIKISVNKRIDETREEGGAKE